VGESPTVRSFCLAIAAVAAAGAAASTGSSGAESRGSFLVTLRGTIQQSATYKRERRQGECAYVVSGRWNNTLELHSQRPTKLVVTTGSGRLRFSPAGIVAVSGKRTTRGAVVARAPGCETVVSNCAQRTEKFRGGRTAITARRRGVFILGRLRHRQLRPPCGTAGSLGGVRADLDLASSRITAASLFGATHRRIVVSGSYESEEDLEPPQADSGTLVTRVSWSLDFTRLSP
jgi:hypothetical protein